MNHIHRLAVTDAVLAKIVLTLNTPAVLDHESIAILAEKKPIDDIEGFLVEGELMSSTAENGDIILLGRFGGKLRAIRQLTGGLTDLPGHTTLVSLNDWEFDNFLEIDHESLVDTNSLKLFLSCFTMADDLIPIVLNLDLEMNASYVYPPVDMSGKNSSTVRHIRTIEYTGADEASRARRERMDSLMGSTLVPDAENVVERHDVVVESVYFDASKGGRVDEVKATGHVTYSHTPEDFHKAVYGENDPSLGQEEILPESEPQVTEPKASTLGEAMARVRNLRQSKYAPKASTVQTIGKVIVGAIVVYAGLKIYNKLAH